MTYILSTRCAMHKYVAVAGPFATLKILNIPKLSDHWAEGVSPLRVLIG